jgi:tetratricopeptide (TPR) repeat protein
MSQNHDGDPTPSLRSGAEALIAAANWTAALVLLDQYIAQSPSDAAAWCSKGRCHLALAQREEAEKAFVRCLELEPGRAEAVAGLAQLRPAPPAQPQPSTLPDAAAPAAPVREDPDRAERLLQEANLHRVRRDPDAALARAKAALALNPHDAAIPFFIGETYLQQKQAAEALPYLEQALRLRPDWLRAGELLERARRSVPKAPAAPAPSAAPAAAPAPAVAEAPRAPTADAAAARSLMDGLVEAIPASFRPGNLLLAVAGILLATLLAAPFAYLAARLVADQKVSGGVALLFVGSAILYLGLMATYTLLCRRAHTERTGAIDSPGEALAFVGRHGFATIGLPIVFTVLATIAGVIASIIGYFVARAVDHHALVVMPVVLVLFVVHVAVTYVALAAHALLPAAVAVDTLPLAEAFAAMGRILKGFRRVLSYQTIVAMGLVPLAVVTFGLTVPALGQAVAAVMPNAFSFVEQASRAAASGDGGLAGVGGLGGDIARAMSGALAGSAAAALPIGLAAACCLLVYIASSQTAVWRHLRES